MRTLTTTELTQTNGAAGLLDLSLDNLRHRVIEPGVAGAAFSLVFAAVTKSPFNKMVTLGYAAGAIMAYNVYDIAKS